MFASPLCRTISKFQPRSGQSSMEWTPPSRQPWSSRQKRWRSTYSRPLYNHPQHSHPRRQPRGSAGPEAPTRLTHQGTRLWPTLSQMTIPARLFQHPSQPSQFPHTIRRTFLLVARRAVTHEASQWIPAVFSPKVKSILRLHPLWTLPCPNP